MSVTLYDRKADLSKRDVDGKIPLMAAASKRKREVVKYILSHLGNDSHGGDFIDGQEPAEWEILTLETCELDDLLIAAVQTGNLLTIKVSKMCFLDILACIACFYRQSAIGLDLIGLKSC